VWEEEEKQQLKQVLLRVRLDELASIQLAALLCADQSFTWCCFSTSWCLSSDQAAFRDANRTRNERGSLEEDAAAVLVSLGVIELVIRLVGGERRSVTIDVVLVVRTPLYINIYRVPFAISLFQMSSLS